MTVSTLLATQRNSRNNYDKSSLPCSYSASETSLLDNDFPSFKTLTILITTQADEDHDVTEWVNSFNEWKYVKLCPNRGVDISVLVETNLGELLQPNAPLTKYLTRAEDVMVFQFASDPRWECVIGD